MGASNGPIRQRTAMAMGKSASVGTKGGVSFTPGKGGTPLGGTSAPMKSTMPMVSKAAKPKGVK